MLEDTTRAALLTWGAERSALVAEILRRRGPLRQSVRLRVRGESMLPTLWPDDMVEIASCSLAEVQPGDILLALRDGRLFLHRLVSTQPDGFVLRGDSMPGSDPRFPPEALLGRLVRSLDTVTTDEERGFSPSWLYRIAGTLLCHCSVARRLALSVHRRRKASAREFRSAQSLQ